MKDALKQRWMIVWVIWGTALLLTYCNQEMIENINAQRALSETRQMASAFVQKNTKDIGRLLNRKAAYRQPVESIQMGCLSLKTGLRALASAHNLMIMEFHIDTDRPASDSVPITLSMVGTYADTLSWLAAVEQDFTYASVVYLKAQRAQGLHMPQFEVRIQYYFEVTETLSSG
jgi:hypothetical protein